MNVLAYADDSVAHRRRRWIKRSLIFATMLVAIYLLSVAGVAIQRRAAYLYWQHRCATFDMATINQPPRRMGEMNDATHCWSSYTHALSGLGVIVPTEMSQTGFSPPAYLHELACPSGRRKIVEVGISFGFHGDEYLSWATADSNAISVPNSLQHGDFFLWSGPAEWSVYVDSITSDPSNRSHLIVHLQQMNGDATPSMTARLAHGVWHNRLIDFWLQDDGALKIVPR